MHGTGGGGGGGGDCSSSTAAACRSGEGGGTLIVVAHPDDECMFFSPTILSLVCNGIPVSLLCLSNGQCTSKAKARKGSIIIIMYRYGIPLGPGSLLCFWLLTSLLYSARPGEFKSFVMVLSCTSIPAAFVLRVSFRPAAPSPSLTSHIPTLPLLLL